MRVASDSQVGFDSDYNLFDIGGTAKFGEWQNVEFSDPISDPNVRAKWWFETGQEQHGQAAAAGFADPDGGDDVLGYSTEPASDPPVIIDNGKAGYTASVGTWTNLASGDAYDSDMESSSGASDDLAMWTFDVTPGDLYDVKVTWDGLNLSPHGYGRYSTYDDGNLADSRIFWQRYEPNDFTDASGHGWGNLGTLTATGSTISVELSQYSWYTYSLLADAVRLQLLNGNRGADDDFSLIGTAPAIDAGDPSYDYSLEPTTNGGRINLGAFGNTADAAASPAKVLRVLSPNGLEKYEADETVEILYASDGLDAGDTVDIDFFDGATWTNLATAQPLDADGEGSYLWTDPKPVTAGNEAWIRVTVTGGALSDESDRGFLIANDANQYYLSPTGSNFNSGKSAAEPMVNVATLVAEYELDPGDVVNVAEGRYTLLRNVELSAADQGAPENPLVFQGTGEEQSLLDRANSEWTRRLFELSGASDITLQNLGVAGAETGIWVASNSDRPHLFGNLAVGNGTGVSLDSTTDSAQLVGNLALENGVGIYSDAPLANIESNLAAENSTGIDVRGVGSTVRGNRVLGNSNTGIVASYYGLDRIVVESNYVGLNRYTGIDAGSSVDVVGNTVFGQEAGTGVSASGDALVEDNSIYGNRTGVSASGSVLISNNKVYNNEDRGISARNSVDIRDNQVYSNSTGIVAEGYTYSPYQGHVTHNLIYDNINSGIRVLGGNNALVELNTVYQEVGDAVEVSSRSANVQVINNILSVRDGAAMVVSVDSQSGFRSDYNLYDFAVDGFFGTWQGVEFMGADARPQWFFATGQDEHSRIGDPSFFDIDGPDDSFGYSEVEVGAAIVVDNSDGEYSSDGGWYDVSDSSAYDGSYQRHDSGSENDIASWTFVGLVPGATYRVAATWPSTNYDATYRIYDGGFDPTVLDPLDDLLGGRTLTTYYPNDFEADGFDWENIGEVAISGDSLVIQLPQHEFRTLRADAIRIQRIEGNGGMDDDFHLQPDSDGLDTGAPASDYSSEVAPNGGRVNLGRYGNTSDATPSPSPLLQVLSPNGYEKYEVGQTVEISYASDGLAGGSTVALEVSTDNGSTWAPIVSGLTPGPSGEGTYSWPASAATIDNTALIRAVSGSTSDVSDEPFLIANDGPNYYLNDQSDVGDVFTTALGNNLNSGKSADRPMETLAALLASYDLDAGDTVFVDTGDYLALRDALLTLQDAGVTIRGPSTGSAVIDRDNPDGDVLRITNADGVTLESFGVTGGNAGITAFSSPDLTMDSLRVFGNDYQGVNVSTGSDNFQIRNSEVFENGSGIGAYSADAVIENNLAYGNGTGVQAEGARSVVQDNTVRGNGTGIRVGNYSLAGTDRIVVTGNNVFDNSGTGIYAFSNSLITDNDVSHHSGTGIEASNGGEITGNDVYDNYSGIETSGDAIVSKNRVFGNSNVGIRAEYQGLITNNYVYSNQVGIVGVGYYYWLPFAGEISNNLVYGSTDSGINLYGADSALLYNNTVFVDVGEAVRVEGDSVDVKLRNNVLSVNAGFHVIVDQYSQTNFDSDYNLFYRGPAGQARIGFWGAGDPAADPQTTLSDWQTATGGDGHSYSEDPLFVNPAGADNVLGYTSDPVPYDGGADDNFYLKKKSAAIDSGDEVGASMEDIEGFSRVDDPGTPNGGTGAGFTDMGAYEFRGSSFDDAPPVVTATMPSVIHSAGSTYSSFLTITLEFSEALNPIDANAPALYELRRDVGGGGFGDGDDEVYLLTPSYVGSSNVVTLQIDAADGYLPAGNYQFSVAGDDLHDLAGLELDGDGDGGEGGDYVREFELLPLIIVTPSVPEPLVTTEAGGSAMFTVGLALAPENNVTINLHSTNAGEGTISPSSLVFTPSDYGAKTVTVEGVEDFYDDGDVSYTIITDSAISSDPQYSGLESADVQVINLDDDVAGVTVTPTPDKQTSESGDTATFTVVLEARPFENVMIGLGSTDPTEGTTNPSGLVFTTDNWNVPQTVTVRGVDDDVDDDDQPYNIKVLPAISTDSAFDGLGGTTIPYINLDEDVAGITVDPLSPRHVTTEAGGSDFFDVMLNSEPVRYVVMVLESNDTTEGGVTHKQRVFFGPNDWDQAQVMTITGVDDAILDGDQLYDILISPIQSPDPQYDAIDPPDVPAINLDDETFTCGPPAPGSPLHVFRQCEGQIIDPTTLSTTLVVDPTTFDLAAGLPAGETRLSFHMIGSAGLDPAAIEIRDESGTIVTPYYSNSDLAGGAESLVLAVLTSPQTYTLRIAGDSGSSGDFTLNVGLLGDVNGDRRVDVADRGLYFGGYREEADANQDGVISSWDYFQWRYNYGDIKHAPIYLAAASPAGDSQPARQLDSGSLESAVAHAIDQFARAGLDASRIAELQQISVHVADLQHDTLGLAGDYDIWIDRDAQGWGWHIDATADLNGAAVGGVDLLTVVMHEMGHALGLGDLHPSEAHDDLMTGLLAPGKRRSLGSVLDRVGQPADSSASVQMLPLAAQAFSTPMLSTAAQGRDIAKAVHGDRGLTDDRDGDRINARHCVFAEIAIAAKRAAGSRLPASRGNATVGADDQRTALQLDEDLLETLAIDWAE